MNAHHLVQRLTDGEDTTNICLTVVLRSGEHELETLLQTDGHPTWSLCGGHQQDDETAEEAAGRELKEESGIDTTVDWLADLKNHCIRNRPAKIFYAVVAADTEAKAGSDVEKVKWVPVTALGDLNDDDAKLIQMAAQRVHDPEALVMDAIARSPYAVQGLAADIAPRGPQGVLIALEGEDPHPHAQALANHLRERKTACSVVNGHLSLVAESALESAHRLRKLTPLTEAIIKAADALHRWENQVKPALDAGQTVICEHWTAHDRKACLQRGLEPDLFEALFRFLPQPDLTLQISGETTDQIVRRFNALTEAAPEDDPEEFFHNFVDKNLGRTFYIMCSGELNVYGTGLFHGEWLVYSNDPEPPGGWKLPPGGYSSGKGETRSFEGYLIQRGNQWEAYQKAAGNLRSERCLPQFSLGLFPTQELAACALHRFNSQPG